MSIIKAVLYQPTSWTGDEKRMDKVGVPKGQWAYKTKIKIALGLVVDINLTTIGFLQHGLISFFEYQLLKPVF